MNLESRVDRIEEAILIMKDLLVSHDERLEKYFNAMNESRQDFDFKMNALIDAQIRNQDEISELKETSKSVIQRLDRLET
jgi:vacuolar-type H+-ATPase subunit I/STV1